MIGWKETDERLLGEENSSWTLNPSKTTDKNSKMNKGKRGSHYWIPDPVIRLLAAVRILYQIPYRQLEGFTRTLHRLVPELPEADYSGIRKPYQAPTRRPLQTPQRSLRVSYPRRGQRRLF